MHCTPSYFFLSIFIFLGNLYHVQATLYIIEPSENATYSGGKKLTVSWLDDGSEPVLSNIGPCHVALYNGNSTLIQQIEPVDVSAVHSLQFIPDPSAGPDSSIYYINFTSVNSVGSPAATYSQFSPFFTLNSMTGSFSAPVASDTSSIAVPSSVLSPPPNTITSTSIIGTPFSTPLPSLPPLPPPSSSSSVTSSASGMKTVSSSSFSSSSASPSNTQSTPGTATRTTSAACARFGTPTTNTFLAFCAASLLFARMTL